VDGTFPANLDLSSDLRRRKCISLLYSTEGSLEGTVESDIETTTIIYQCTNHTYNKGRYEASPEGAIEELLLMHLDSSLQQVKPLQQAPT
jgi:hypothetical protein